MAELGVVFAYPGSSQPLSKNMAMSPTNGKRSHFQSARPHGQIAALEGTICDQRVVSTNAYPESESIVLCSTSHALVQARRPATWPSMRHPRKLAGPVATARDSR